MAKGVERIAAVSNVVCSAKKLARPGEEAFGRRQELIESVQSAMVFSI